MKLYQRMQKRLAIAVVAATALTTVASPVFAADYDGHWAASAITEWKDKGVINGYEDGSFKPKQNITRAELATILVNVFKLQDTKNAKAFSDVNESAWYADAVAKVSSADIMHTEGKYFNPNTPATREEAAYALAKAYKLSGGSGSNFKDADEISSWSQDAIAALVSGGYIGGRPDGTFAPKDNLTRADMVTMIDKITAELYNQAGTYNKDVTGNVVISAPDVQLKGMKVDGNLYIAQGVGDGDVTLEDVEVTGQVFVEGGGLSSIKLKGKTKVPKLTVNKPDGNVRIVTSGDVKVGNVTAQSGVSLEGNFNQVVVTNKVEVNVLGKSVIGTITVEKTAEGVTLKLSVDTTISNVSLQAKADITGKGKIENLTLSSEINKGDLKIEATVQKTTGGKDSSSTDNSSSSNNNSSSDSTHRPSVVSSYSVSGQLKFKEINLGEGKEVKIIPCITVDGKEQLDYQNAIVVKSNDRGQFTAASVPSYKKYVVATGFNNSDGSCCYLEQVINSLNANQSLTMDLSQGVCIEYAEAVSDNSFIIRTNKVNLDVYVIQEIDGNFPPQHREVDEYGQTIWVNLPDGKSFEDGKEYTAIAKKEGYMDYAKYQFTYHKTSDTPVVKYKITTSQGEGYTIAVDKVEEEAGKAVSFTVVPTAGYEVQEVKVNGALCQADNNGVYSFTMPSNAVKIEVIVKTSTNTDKPSEGTVTWDTSKSNGTKASTLAEAAKAITTTSAYTVTGEKLDIEWSVTTDGPIKTLEAITTTSQAYTVVGKVTTTKDSEPVTETKTFEVKIIYISEENKYMLEMKEKSN